MLGGPLPAPVEGQQVHHGSECAVENERENTDTIPGSDGVQRLIEQRASFAIQPLCKCNGPLCKVNVAQKMAVPEVSSTLLQNCDGTVQLLLRLVYSEAVHEHLCPHDPRQHRRNRSLLR